jgi:acetyl-CoA acetyltransferase
VAERYAPGLIPQGISAELIAGRWGFSRAQLDEFAASSHERAALAWKEGLFDREVVGVNEAFAAVVLAWQAETGAALDKVNINGGAIAIGHPLGVC